MKYVLQFIFTMHCYTLRTNIMSYDANVTKLMQRNKTNGKDLGSKKY